MCNDFYVLETLGRSRVITGGREAAATPWETITPNSWELSRIYDAVSAGNEGWRWWRGVPEPGQAAGAEAGLGAGWVASRRRGAGPAAAWLGGLVLSSCTLWASPAAGGIGRAAPGPQLFREARGQAGQAGRGGQEANPGSEEPGACPPNTGAPAGLPGAAATLEKVK